MSTFYKEIQDKLVKKDKNPAKRSNPKVVKTKVVPEDKKEQFTKLFNTLPNVSATETSVGAIHRATSIFKLTLDEVKQFLRIDEEDETEDDYLNMIVIPSAISYVCNYTGLTKDKLAEKEELKSATLIVCSMMFDNRSAMVSSHVKMNPILTSILDLNSVNLL